MTNLKSTLMKYHLLWVSSKIWNQFQRHTYGLLNLLQKYM